MSKRNGSNKLRLEKLDEINQIDRRMKKKKIRENEAEVSKLMSRRDTLRQQLKNNMKSQMDRGSSHQLHIIKIELSKTNEKLDKLAELLAKLISDNIRLHNNSK